jgi:hypothetical protein
MILLAIVLPNVPAIAQVIGGAAMVVIGLAIFRSKRRAQ